MDTSSDLLKAARLVLHDVDLRARVNVALIAGGYVAADLDQVFTWLLASPGLPGLLADVMSAPEVEALLDGRGELADGTGSLASLATVEQTGPDLAPVITTKSAAIPDALLIACIEAAYMSREKYGLPITRHADAVGGA